MEKNIGNQKWIVFAFDRTTNIPQPGDALNITANIRIDGGVANAVDDVNPTELENGYYVFDVTAAETNGDLLTITPASSTADIQVIGVPGAVYTVAPNFNTLGIEADGDLTQVNNCVANSDMKGTNNAALASSLTTAQNDLNTITGSDGVTLASVQGNYAPSKVGDAMDLTTSAVDAVLDEPLSGHIISGTLGKAVADIEVDTNELQTDDIPGLIAGLNNPTLSAIAGAVWNETLAGHITSDTAGLLLNELQDGGRIDLILDELTAQGDTNEIKIDAVPTVGEITADLNTNLDKTGYSLSTAGILAIWHQSLTNIIATGSVGKLLKDEITSTRMAVLTDWIDGGRLDTIIDELTTQGDANKTAIDTANSTLGDGTHGLAALKVLIDTVNNDLSNGIDGLGALKALIDGLQDISANDILTTALTESYAADGATATLSQLLYMIWSFLSSLKFVGTTGTARKLDGTTTAMTFTLDDAVNPTDKNRTT